MIAVKTKRNSQLLLLNSKNERVIVKIPSKEWIVLDVKDYSMVVNKDEIMSVGGQFYSGSWKSNPPFGEDKCSYLRASGERYDLIRDVNFNTVKKVSPFALQAKDEDERNAIAKMAGFNKIIQKSKSDIISTNFSNGLKRNSEKIAYYYYQFKTNQIDGITFQQSVDSLNSDFLSSFIDEIYDYYNSVIGFEGVENVDTLSAISPRILSRVAGFSDGSNSAVSLPKSGSNEPGLG